MRTVLVLLGLGLLLMGVVADADGRQRAVQAQSDPDAEVLVLVPGRDIAGAQIAGPHLVMHTAGGAVFVYDLPSQSYVASYLRPFSWLRAVEMRADGMLMMLAGDDRIEMWDLDARALTTTIAVDTDVRTADLGQRGHRVAVVGVDNVVRWWDTATGQLQQRVTLPTANRAAVALSPDEQLVAVGLEDAVIVLDAATGEQRYRWQTPDHPPEDVSFLPDSDGLVVAAEALYVWQFGRPAARLLATGDSALRGVDVRNDGRFVVARQAWNSDVLVLDISSAEMSIVIDAHEWVIDSARFSADGCLIVTAADDDTVRVTPFAPRGASSGGPDCVYVE